MYVTHIIIILHSFKIIPELSCGEPPAVPDASFEAESQLYGDVASFACDPGFEVAGGVNNWIVTCQSDGMWSEGSHCKRKHFGFEGQMSRDMSKYNYNMMFQNSKTGL